MLQRKLLEGIVSSVVVVLRGLKRDATDAVRNYRHGVYDTVTSLLLRPGVTEPAMYEKVKAAFEPVHRDWTHTKLAEEKIVDALLA